MLKKLFKCCVVSLSLFVFMVTLAGSAFGYAWCFGEGHSKIEKLTALGCDEKGLNCSESVGQVDSELTRCDHSRQCFDVQISQKHAVTGKRSLKHFKAHLDTKSPVVSAFFISQLDVKSPTVASPPRLTQTILSHRTVVLLI